MRSRFSRVRLFATLWNVAHQVPLAIAFFRQEYWSGLLCPPAGDLPDPGIELKSAALQADSLPQSHRRSPVPITTFIYFQKLFITLKRNPVPTKQSLPTPAPQAPGYYQHISISVDLPIVDILYKRNHIAWFWLLSLSMMFTSFIHIVACVNTFYGGIIFRYLDIPYPVHPLFSWHWPFPFE